MYFRLAFKICYIAIFPKHSLQLPRGGLTLAHHLSAALIAAALVKAPPLISKIPYGAILPKEGVDLFIEVVSRSPMIYCGMDSDGHANPHPQIRYITILPKDSVQVSCKVALLHDLPTLGYDLGHLEGTT